MRHNSSKRLLYIAYFNLADAVDSNQTKNPMFSNPFVRRPQRTKKPAGTTGGLIDRY